MNLQAVLGPAKAEARAYSTDFKSGGNLDLQKLDAFFARTGFRERIKETKRAGGPKTSEAIQEAFAIYCVQLRARNVAYQYGAFQSPFDRQFTGKRDCKGRAKGFLQLMSVMGVPLDSLNIVMLDGLQTESKIAKLSDRSIHSERVFRVPMSPSEYASNAVTASLKGGKLTFSRTDREPFMNHYAAKVSIGSSGFEYWDPLFSRGYKNGMSDFFESYTRDAGLSESGVDCYAARERRRRLYRLPERWNSTRTARDDAAFQTALKEQGGLDSKPRLFVIIDEDDWGAEPPQTHPAVVRHIMRSLDGSVRGA